DSLSIKDQLKSLVSVCNTFESLLFSFLSVIGKGLKTSSSMHMLYLD
ncbi:hypothetical protein CUMW_069550, partial [Citrus unshiu]